MITDISVLQDQDNETESLEGFLDTRVLGVKTPWLIGGTLMLVSLLLFLKKKKRRR